MAKVRLAAPLIGGALMLAGMLSHAGAQGTYPTQPVRVIVPFAPGGASDFAARLIQPRMTQSLGQPIVIENKGGAAGNIGMEAAAQAAPDGYTVFLGNVGTMAINKALFADLKVDPVKDFIGVSLITETPGLLVANPKFPPNTVPELVEYIKARPGQVKFGSPGSASLNRFDMEVFLRDAGLNIIHVPYKGGAGPAVADVIGDEVPLLFVTISSAIQPLQAGRLKALAVTSKERVPSLPDVPTMLELGYKNNVSTSWQGMLVPAGTPQPVVDKIFAAVTHALSDPKVRERMNEAGALPLASKSPEEFRQYIAAEAAKWSRVVQETGAKPD
jgi:tripartite-type tricarboxylate transporter receptor subunit TctC